MQQQFVIAYTHWSNVAEAMVMILFWSIGMGSVMKIHTSKSPREIHFFLPEFAVNVEKTTSDIVSLRFETCEFALVFVGYQARSF